MFTSRAWVISSGLVGAISLIFRLLLNFSITGAHFSLPTFNPLVIINVIIFALAASASLFGHGADSPVKEHHHDDDHTNHYEYDHHDYHHGHNHNHNHDHELSSKNSSDSSFDQYNKKAHEEEKLHVRSETGGSYGFHRPILSPGVSFPSTSPPEKAAGFRSPLSAPLKTFPQDEKSGDESETMEEMWKRIKAEKQPTKPNAWQDHVVSRSRSRMSTSSCPSPSRARKPPLPQPSQSPSRTKIIERVPTWVKLKKELSMGRDELHSRVEAFIRKFNDEMKLQRLESLKRYKLFRRGSDEK